MNAERLLQHFDRIAEAPDAVAYLRRFILDLAVRGKLVDQDPNDEPASELVKRIQAEKTRLAKEGFIKKGKQFSEIEDDEVSFDIPNAWKWVRIRQITSDRGQAVPTTDFTYIDVTSINKERGCISEPKILSVSEAPSRARKLVRKDNVIYSCVRPYLLNIAVVDAEIVPPPVASTAFAILYGFGLVLPRYLWITLRSPFMVESVESKMRGQAYPAINDADFAVLPIPLPPLPEQHRIVAKVDELMGLCDRLQSAQQNRESQRDRLVAASLHHLNQSADGDRARFYFNHLSRLTVRSEHIKELRQTILNLAVRGKLVPQDPNDEPASELLNRIQAEKHRLLEDGIIKKQKPLLPLTNEDVPFSLPEQWTWVRLSDITDVQDPNPSHRMPQYILEGGVPFISSENFVDVDNINFQIGKQVSQKTLEEQINRFSILSGALAFTRIGTIGKSRFLPSQRTYCLSHALCVINPIHQFSLSMRLLRATLAAELILAFAHRGTRSIGVPDLGMGVIRSMAIPLPPLAEQHRIIAKVDELMGLCDRLETQLTTTQTHSRQLLESLLHEALAPSI